MFGHHITNLKPKSKKGKAPKVAAHITTSLHVTSKI